MDISFIIVNYKSQELLLKCLAAIVQHAPLAKYEIIIVNNDKAPLNNSFDSLSLKIINNNENKGFAKACNVGSKEATGKIIFFINPDTEIKTSNLDDLVKKLYESGVGIVAPRLISPSGSVQPWSAGSEITLLDILRNNLGFIKSRKIWQRNTAGEIDWVSGAAFLISKEFFFKCGGFDENFFMYFEDIDLCRRVRQLGKKIFLLPHVQVLHFGGQGFSSKTEQKYHYYKSQDYYFKKHFGAITAYLTKFIREIRLSFQRHYSL